MLRECMEYAVLFGKLSLTVAPAQDNTHTQKRKVNCATAKRRRDSLCSRLIKTKNRLKIGLKNSLPQECTE